MTRIRAGVALLATSVLWSATAWAQGTTTSPGPTPGAQMYELTETARLIGRGAATSEMSTSAMMGFAQVGSPLCPSTSPALAVAPGSRSLGNGTAPCPNATTPLEKGDMGCQGSPDCVNT